MGKVLTRLKVFPQENQDLEELKARVEKVEGFNTGKIEDYVFGQKILIASFICNDGENKDYEEIVKQVQGVSEVQVEEVGLL